MSKTIIISHPEHQLYPLLKECPNFFELDDEELVTDHLVGLPKGSRVLDFSVGTTDEKKGLFELLEDEGLDIYSELSSNWGEGLTEAYPRLKGVMGSSFYSPQQTYEIWGRTEKDTSLLNTFFEEQGLKTQTVSSPGIGLHFPRVLAQIINEAFFALEDGLATSKDIDKAMCFGVNYPLGPFEWLEKCGVAPVLHLLDELYAITGDPRYRAAMSLRKKLLRN
jgi:3-hydroxybutyryl-CoA dehydrogenase